MDRGVDARVRLPEGRWLSYREFGDPAGAPLIFLHGLPGSRFQCPDDGSALELGVRLIAPERPGYGASEPRPDTYRLADWSSDVVALADALRIKRFAVAGYSIGGMFALACAHALPTRVTRLGLISSLAPLDVPENWNSWQGALRGLYELARTDVPALQRALEPLADPEAFLAAMIELASDVDKQMCTEPALRQALLRDLRETLRLGTDAAIRDMMLAAHNWQIDLGRIRVPAFVWHGAEDLHAPPAMAKYLAATIPACQGRLYPNEGHFLMFRRWREILDPLALGGLRL